MNEEEPIQCSCFNNPIISSTSGLKPLKLVYSQPSAFLKNSQQVQNKAMANQLDTNKIKMSLKRLKHQIRSTIVKVKSPTFTVPSFLNTKTNDQVFTLRETILKVNPINIVSFGQQKVNYAKKQSFFFQKEMIKREKDQKNENFKPFLGNCNIVSMPTTQKTPKITIKYQNKPSIRFKEGSQFKIPSQQIFFKVEQLQIDIPTGKSKKSSSSTQKRCKNNRSSINHHQPLRMIRKEIESLVDENDLNDDLSEVIGRGWDQDEDSFEFMKNKEFINETQTHPTSASNIKSSSLASGF